MVSKDKNISHEEKKGMELNSNLIADAIANALLVELQAKEPKQDFPEVETEFDFEEYRNLLETENKRIKQEMSQLNQRRNLMVGWWKGIEYYRDALTKSCSEIDQREKTIKELRLQLEEKERDYEILSGTAKNLMDAATDARERKKELEMKLAEMKKISEGMAKKASEDAVLGFIHTCIIHSRRKTPDKKAFVKQAILELANANGLTLPPDLASAVDHLDDILAEPKVVNVGNGGQYNDIHDNNNVNQR